MECTQIYVKFNADSVHKVKDKMKNCLETTKQKRIQ